MIKDITMDGVTLIVKDGKLIVRGQFFEESGWEIHHECDSWVIEETPMYGGEPVVNSVHQFLDEAIKEALTYT